MGSRRARTQGLGLALALWLAAPPSAAGQTHPPITSRDYALDLYQSTVLGSSKTIGMGGAVIAVAEGALGMDQNPAAPAARPATSSRTWDWDAGLDWLNPDLAGDVDNTGITTTSVHHTVLVTGSLVGQWRQWGLGASVGFTRSLITLDDGTEADPETLYVHAALARTFVDEQVLVGLGVRTASFSLGKVTNGTRTQGLFTLSGSTLEAGFLWRPHDRDLRVGGAVAASVSSDEPVEESCDPNNCGGYILPNAVIVPWTLSGGVAYRLAPSRWNVKIADDFRDERALVLAADLVLTGPAENGYGVTAFLDKTLQESGRGLSLSVRVGADFEWIPGWLRVRAGSYWEPGRFTDVNGRVHVTMGVDVRFARFCAWGSPYRLRATATGDFAERYGNAGVSIGFWH